MIEKLSDNPNSEALSWLFEMELVNNPIVLNSLILNLLGGIRGVKNTELVIDEKQKKILIFLELKWLHRRFKKENIENKVSEIVSQVLPNFKKRIIFERSILEKALKIAAARQ